MKLRSNVALPLMMVMVLIGCPKDKDARYKKAAESARTFAISARAAQQTVKVLHETKRTISDDEYKFIQQKFEYLADFGKRTDQIIRVGSKTDLNEAQVVLDETLNATKDLIDNGVAQVKNPEAKAELMAIVISIKTALDTIYIALH